MSLNPAVRTKVGGDAGGQEAEADAESADDPVELDAALEHEEVEDAEDEDQNGCFRAEGGAAARGDDDQIEERGVGLGRGFIASLNWHEVKGRGIGGVV
jgi:hypothetical protein